MRTEKATRETIEDFLAQKRIAMVGLSREGQDFSVNLFKELRRRGYDVVPVNPKMTELWGPQCFARVQDIQPPVDGALLMTSPSVTEAVVRDCAEAGIRRVWMYRAVGQGAVSDEAVDFCRDARDCRRAGRVPVYVSAEERVPRNPWIHPEDHWALPATWGQRYCVGRDLPSC